MLDTHRPGRQHDPAAEGRRPTRSTYAIDFINTEQVAPIANPDPARYAHADRLHPPGRAERARPGRGMDTTGNLIGVYLPAGRLPDRRSKFQVYGKAVQVVGAGPWYTRFLAPSGAGEHRRRLPRGGVGERLDVRELRLLRQLHLAASTARARCSTSPTSSNMTIDNIWVEHMVCLYWGANTDNMTIKNSRIRNMFADGINMTNGSTNNLVSQQRGPGHRRRQLRAVLGHRRGRRAT